MDLEALVGALLAEVEPAGAGKIVTNKSYLFLGGLWHNDP